MVKTAFAIVFLIVHLVLAGPSGDRADELIAAAKKGDADMVEALLAKGANVNAKNEYGATALTFAADKGHLAVIKVLLQNKADVNIRDTFYKATPLDWAFMRKHVDVIKVLVEAGASGAEAGLRSAAAAGQRDVVQAILDTNKLKEADLTKALAATPEKHAAIAEMLNKAGAKAAAKTDVVVDAKTLASYVGTYRGERDAEYKVTMADGKLALRFGAGGSLSIKAIDKTSFVTADSDTTITFDSAGEGKATSFTLKTASTKAIFKRVADAKESTPALAKVEDPGGVVTTSLNWPSFRGRHASGIADGQFPPLTWDAAKKHNIREDSDPWLGIIVSGRVGGSHLR